VHWEYACLAAQSDLLGFSLYLRPVVHRKPQGIRWWHQSPPGREAGSRVVEHATLQSLPLQGGRIQNCRTCGTPEPSLTGRRDREPRYSWRHRSPSNQVGRIRMHWTHGSPGAHLDWEAGSGVVGHVVLRGCTPRSLS
jgi:hypothetical protein